MAPSVVKVDGYKKACEILEANKSNPNVFVLFSGAKDDQGKSWCPDCVKAEPVITAEFQKCPNDFMLIYCSVGDRASWKDKTNVFRTDPKLRLNSVPTLVKWGKPQKLEEEQCADPKLVEMMFEED